MDWRSPQVDLWLVGHREADVLIGEALRPVRPHGLNPVEGKADHSTLRRLLYLQRPVGRFTEAFFSTSRGCKIDPVTRLTGTPHAVPRFDDAPLPALFQPFFPERAVQGRIATSLLLHRSLYPLKG